MSKRNRVFLGILFIYALGVIYLLYKISADLDPRYQESAEESLVETAHLLSAFIETDLRDDGHLRPEALRAAFVRLNQHRFRARIYSIEKTRIDLRTYVTDRNGKVVFDSTGMNEGQDFLKWHDVSMTLKGQYGARTTQDLHGIPETAVMYVGAPIRWNENHRFGHRRQTGAEFRQIRHQCTAKVVRGRHLRGCPAMLALFVSVWLVRPFGLLTNHAWYVSARASLPRMGRRAIGVIGALTMRCATLAGRTTEGTQTSTKIKSYSSGATELLQEPMPEAKRGYSEKYP